MSRSKFLATANSRAAFGLVNDVVESLVRLQNCEKARGEIFNVGGTEEVSMLKLARARGADARLEIPDRANSLRPGVCAGL